ncbi:MAG: cadherin repeat domain-containing protein [Pirellulaceae bacterium]|nr:cadherin repeat domain-containing protein [Pirellulaceae bacterium]
MMSRREKLLLAAVALLVVVFVGIWAVQQVSGWFSLREDQIATLEEEIRTKEFTRLRGTRAAEQLAVWESQALPEDRELARSMYQSWLLQAVENVDLQDVKVDPVGGRPVGDVYFIHPFNVSGRGNLEQLVAFLYDFHAADLLHRIERMTVTPIRDSKLLDIVFTVEAVSLPGSSNVDKLPVERRSSRLAWDSLEKYQAPILRRNLFGPPNSSPRLESPRTQEAIVHQPFRMRVRASDPDEKDLLQYSLQADEKLGARINSATGELEFTPTELGEYEFTVSVQDNGLPQASHETQFTVRVVEPPPPREVAQPVPSPPRFDEAGYAYVIGVVEINGRPQIWVSVRTSGQLLKLHEGERVTVGQFDGVIRRIHPKAIEFESGDRNLFVKFGDHLGQATEVNADDI